ncbi:FKBP-type peptidyl-prolyl cis-trans isomerase [Ferrovibrio sp.]|uniref:FKBP-type peptidyl-prolyl cis-trans isomerase n=1 Tax=Ferrovibrio sp. TaxID=1917215 RepID=UPI00260E843E|nr:FKBP-type peptidyl-prolyl cis-trans isomerase [Ferrovibrio sp.]
MPLSRRAVAVAIVLGLSAVALPRVPAFAQEQTTASGLRYTETKLGNGEIARSGQTAVVHYTGWLMEGGKKGRKFDSSRDRGQPFAFPLGAGRVIKGWDQGVAGMKTGGQRTLVIPPQLGYGAAGAGGGVIPPNATLIFDVELIELR